MKSQKGAQHRYELPGHGEDRRPGENVTLQDYVDRIIEVVSASEKTPILVGHSMGGVISQAAELVSCDRRLGRFRDA